MKDETMSTLGVLFARLNNFEEISVIYSVFRIARTLKHQTNVYYWFGAEGMCTSFFAG